jgi:hypothetical protein
VINTKLLKILKSFSPEEIKDFSRYIETPFHDATLTAARLYKILKKHYPEFKPNALKQEKLFNKLFPGKKYNDGTMRNLFSELSTHAENFLVFTDYKEDEFDYSKRLLNQYNKRDLDKLFEIYIKRTFNTLEGIKVKDENYYHKRFILESIQFEFYNTRTPIGKSEPLFLQRKDVINYFVNYFLITMLREYFDMINAGGLLKFDYKFTFFEEIMQHISRQKRDYRKILLIDILHRFLQLFNNEQDESFEDELKILIETNKDSLEKYDYRNFMIELYNYYKAKEDQGIKSYGLKSFKLMNEMLPQGLFYQKDGFLTAHSYINLVSSALRENELVWAEHFINEYKDKVQADQRENAFLFSIATLFSVRAENSSGKMKKKYYSLSLDYLAKVKTEDFYYMTRVKNMLIRIYYELNEIELAISILESYRHFLSKTKVMPEDLYERYINFINFTGKLIKYKTQSLNITLEQLRDDIVSTKLVSYRGWLLSKISDLNHTKDTSNLVNIP